eukprot:NODE_3251_length_1002_cov_26.370286_g3105_i0.p1 GENE.NODE_3251_length_1002_cov_26.370286_g3105_i0~~NODE_3251_length_1002_cov_26.370286_g3105_i0.p1  ORF type:complete len:294 (+),score=97.42 NODE_3251_length_1002_cov_26.370286_g3105_i0:58-939(+)
MVWRVSSFTLLLGVGLAATKAAPLDARSDMRSKTKGFIWRAWRRYELDTCTVLNPTTKLLRFLFTDGEMEAGLRVISPILGRAADSTGEYQQAPFYPITRNPNKGYFKIISKLRDGDPVAQALHTLQPGDVMEFKAVLPQYLYRPQAHEHVGFVAGGMGILPCYQMVQEVIGNPNDTTKVSVLYACRKREDLVLKQQLDSLQKRHPQQLRVEYVLEEPPLLWRGHTGRVSTDLIQEHMPNPSASALVMVAGPTGMMDAVCGELQVDQNGWHTHGGVRGMLSDLGYRRQHVVKL